MRVFVVVCFLMNGWESIGFLVRMFSSLFLLLVLLWFFLLVCWGFFVANCHFCYCWCIMQNISHTTFNMFYTFNFLCFVTNACFIPFTLSVSVKDCKCLFNLNNKVEEKVKEVKSPLLTKKTNILNTLPLKGLGTYFMVVPLFFSFYIVKQNMR